MNQAKEHELAVFEAALQLPVEQRAAYLEQACGADGDLRRRVEDLLGAAARAGGFMRQSAVPEPAAASRLAPTEKPGDMIGRYKLLEQIGEGGCGIVYMAEQQEPVRRRVALKVIKVGMDTKQVVARFEAERQALALMDHPHIAKVLDAGATEAGRPYFVMELVRGIKITEYCDREKLSTEQRLDLFIQVCQAVQHAHQKGIIHRDLKPSNILVADHDGVPVPKVIDFGVAKATTDLRLTNKTLFTAFEQFIGTPAYMSPEQARLSGLDIDTRTDIYSLGVLLYELLTGKTPLDQKELLASGLDEMRRTIREREPVRPSTRLSTMLEGELTTTAKHRRIEVPRLIHQVRGDLDWIAMKALEKDRARRYETANGLAMDVQRYLDDEPVVARPPSRLYEFQKTVRRHKFGFAAAGAVTAALILGLAVATWEYHKERVARQRAEAAEKETGLEAAKATAISKLLQDMLESGDPFYEKGRDFTVRQMLDAYSAGLTNQLAGQPEVEAAVRSIMGWVYYRLGVFSTAESNLLRAMELRHRARSLPSNDSFLTQQYLARLWLDQRKLEQAAALSYETWQGRVQLLGPTNPYTLASKSTYAGTLSETGQLEEAVKLKRQVLHDYESVLGPDDFNTIVELVSLGQTLSLQGNQGEAERCFADGLARFKRIGKEDLQDALTCAKELAMLRLLEGNSAGAEKVMTNILPRASYALTSEHPLTLQL
jgi:eukaryotic-like serine/threonine-protein kinase